MNWPRFLHITRARGRVGSVLTSSAELTDNTSPSYCRHPTLHTKPYVTYPSLLARQRHRMESCSAWISGSALEANGSSSAATTYRRCGFVASGGGGSELRRPSGIKRRYIGWLAAYDGSRFTQYSPAPT